MKRSKSPDRLLPMLLVTGLLLAGCNRAPPGGGGGGGGGSGYISLQMTSVTATDVTGEQSAVIVGLPLTAEQIAIEPAGAQR